MIVRYCPDCGHGGEYANEGNAKRSMTLHSCEHQRKLAAQKPRTREAEPPAPCPHKKKHVHGTTKCRRQDNCKCRPCLDADAADTRERTRRKAYGIADSVPAGPVRVHLARLQHQGMSVDRMAAQAGSHSTIDGLLYGRNGRHTKRVRTATAERLLAITLDLGDQHVDVAGTARRLQALAVIGWTQTMMSDYLGWHRQTINHLITGRRQPNSADARKVADFYDAAWRTPAPTDTPYAKRDSATARTRAAHRGWVGPLAWDDDTIDDPTAKPYRPKSTRDGDPERQLIDDVLVQRALSGVRVAANPKERAEIVRRWRTAGRPLAELDRIQGWNVHRDRRSARGAA